VLFDAKFRRHELAEVLKAAGDIENAIAFLALEVVVVSFVRPLVPGGLAGDLHRFDPALFQECTDCPIDGRDP